MSRKVKFTPVIEDLPQVDFNVTPIFSGLFDRPIIIDNPNADKDKDKTFKLFRFIDLETGEPVTVPSNYSIEKSLDMLEQKKTDFARTGINISFHGKEMLKGKPFSRFTVNTFDLDEWLNASEEPEPEIDLEAKKGKKK